MNVWTVILLTIVSVGLILYFLTAVLGIKSNKLLGLPLILTVISILLGGLSYNFLWEKSIYVVIKSGDSVLYINTIKFNDDSWKKDEEFIFSAKTRGIPIIDYRQQIKDFLVSGDVKLCRDYTSHAIGFGRYKKEAGFVSVCVSKKGVRW